MSTPAQSERDLWWAKECDRLQEENKKLKLTILSLKSSVVDLRESRDQCQQVIEKLQETADPGPDRCEACDTRFDLHYTMNHCDKDLRKKYDDYFCSEEDDGDLCPECI